MTGSTGTTGGMSAPCANSAGPCAARTRFRHRRARYCHWRSRQRLTGGTALSNGIRSHARGAKSSLSAIQLTPLPRLLSTNRPPMPWLCRMYRTPARSLLNHRRLSRAGSRIGRNSGVRSLQLAMSMGKRLRRHRLRQLQLLFPSRSSQLPPKLTNKSPHPARLHRIRAIAGNR